MEMAPRNRCRLGSSSNPPSSPSPPPASPPVLQRRLRRPVRAPCARPRRRRRFRLRAGAPSAPMVATAASAPPGMRPTTPHRPQRRSNRSPTVIAPSHGGGGSVHAGTRRTRSAIRTRLTLVSLLALFTARRALRFRAFRAIGPVGPSRPFGTRRTLLRSRRSPIGSLLALMRLGRVIRPRHPQLAMSLPGRMHLRRAELELLVVLVVLTFRQIVGNRRLAALEEAGEHPAERVPMRRRSA